MTRYAFSGSEFGRVRQCPSSPALPQVRRTTADSEAGRVRHRYLERVSQAGPLVAWGELDEEGRAVCAWIPVEELPMTELSAEVALAYHVVTGKVRLLGIGKGRAYETVEAEEIPLTVDVAGLADRTVVAHDYKGWAHQPPAIEHDQLRLAGLALALLHGVYRAVVGWTCLRGGSPVSDRTVLDAVELDRIEAQVQTTYRAVRSAQARTAAGEPLDVHAGPWCEHCPAFEHCPAKQALVRAIPERLATYEATISALSAEDAGAAHLWRLEQQAVLDRVGAAIDERAKREPLPLPDGRVYGLVETQGNREIDPDIAWMEIAARYGREVADRAFPMVRTGSLGSIAQVAREHAEPRGMGRLKDELLDAIERRGGVTRPEVVRLKIHRPWKAMT